MAANQLRINGLDDLRQALKSLPGELVHEASTIVHTQAEAAQRQVIATYPVGPTGNLRRGVRLETRADDRGSASAKLRSSARHAHLFEQGTKPRQWKNGKSTGVMLARPVFVPIVVERRRVMLAALIELVERAGLKVTAAS